MKKFILVSLLLLGGLPAWAQRGNGPKQWAVGVRFGEPFAINVRKYIGKSNALDINIGSTGTFFSNRSYKRGYYRDAGFALMINYLWQKPISGAPGLQYYYGLGGQLTSRRYYYGPFQEYNNSVALGVTGMLGLEYFFSGAPVSVFVDVSPYVELVPAPFFINFQAGLGGRFNF